MGAPVQMHNSKFKKNKTLNWRTSDGSDIIQKFKTKIKICNVKQIKQCPAEDQQVMEM